MQRRSLAEPPLDEGRADTPAPSNDGDGGSDDVADGSNDKPMKATVAALPDTSLAVVVLAEVLAYTEPEQAAAAARRSTSTAADKLRDLAVTLGEHGVALAVDVGDVQVHLAN